jgi:hypothetical protein
VLRGAVGEPEALKLSAYGLLTFAAVAGALGAFADRARLVMDRVQLEVGVSFEA